MYTLTTTDFDVTTDLDGYSVIEPTTYRVTDADDPDCTGKDRFKRDIVSADPAADEFTNSQNDEALRVFAAALQENEDSPSWGARRLVAFAAGLSAQDFIAGVQKVVRYIDNQNVSAALLADRKMVRHIQRLAEESVENTVMLIQAFGVDTVFGTLPQTVKADSASVLKDESDLDKRETEAANAELLAKFQQAGLATWMVERSNFKRIRRLMRVIQSTSAAHIVSETTKVVVIRKSGFEFEYNIARNTVTKATFLQRNKR